MKTLRVGLIVPINNTTMEGELLAWLPAGSTCRTLRIPRGKGTLLAADLPAYIAQAMALAQGFSGDDIDMVVYGCTAAGFIAGPQRDAEVAAGLCAVTGKPTVTTASAMTAVLKDIGARNIALITPYLEPVNQRLQVFLEESGITVEALSSFLAQTTDELAAITGAQIAARAREVMREHADVDALFVACSQLPTYELLDGLEREFARPVWSSIKATAWYACRQKGTLLPASQLTLLSRAF